MCLFFSTKKAIITMNKNNNVNKFLQSRKTSTSIIAIIRYIMAGRWSFSNACWNLSPQNSHAMESDGIISPQYWQGTLLLKSTFWFVISGTLLVLSASFSPQNSQKLVLLDNSSPQWGHSNLFSFSIFSSWFLEVSDVTFSILVPQLKQNLALSGISSLHSGHLIFIPP